MEMLAKSCWSPACIHHFTSLHFPLSSLRVICLLQFLSDQVFKKPSIFHFFFSQLAPILLFWCTTCLFISSAALSSIFFPSPLAHLFFLTICLSLTAKPQIVGSELSSLVSISWLISVSNHHVSLQCVTVCFKSEAHKEG